MTKSKKKACLLLFALPLLGCSSYYYHAGQFYDGIHHEITAAKLYSQFLAKYPQDPRAAEINLRLGDMEANFFHRCPEARLRYEAAAREFPEQKKIVLRAEAGLLSCPDFFPLSPGYSWVYGDSSSKGKNMKLTRRTLSLGSNAQNKIADVLYAGKNKIRTTETLYTKKDWAIFSKEKRGDLPLLKYPFRAGSVWKEKKNMGERAFLIESDSATARTVAGVFMGCLKIKESYGRFPKSWKYTYYAPFVGVVKTTIAGPGFESPNTELIQYQIPSKN